MTQFAWSFGITLAAAPVVRWSMLRQGVVDVPNLRSSHSVPTPRGGGLACLLGVLVAVLSAQLGGLAVPWSVLAATVVLSLLGYADDLLSLPAVLRLGAQVLVGATMGYAFGGGWLLLAGVVLVPVVVNVVNFMDGINGITSLSMAVWGVTAFLVGRAHDIPGLWLIGAVAAGSSLGFLPWNAPSASLFLGDVGSYLFGGLVVSGLGIGWSNGAPPLLLAAPLALYLADTGTALVRRAARGESILRAHREHTYQQLTAGGRLPHLLVSTGIAVLVCLITLSWTLPYLWSSVLVTVAGCLLYLASPRLLLPAGRLRPGLVADGGQH